MVWGVDCDNDGTADDFDVWKLDYSGSKTAPTVTEVGTGITTTENECYVYDIVICNSNTYVFLLDTIHRVEVWDVDTAPFVERDDSIIGDNSFFDLSFAVVSGNDVYLIGYWQNDINESLTFLHKFDASTLTLSYGALGEAIEDNEKPDRNQQGISYDDIDLFYFILKNTADSKNYLWSWSISLATATNLGEHNIVLMLDRNTAVGVMEKAFHLTEYEIYQIQENNRQLNLIATPDTDAVFIAITDNFLMNDDGDIFEYIDVIDKIMDVTISHEIMECPTCALTIRKDLFPIHDDMVMKFYDYYTSSEVVRLFKGTYNFRDDADGAVPSGWADLSSGTCTTTIIASEDGHRKVLKLDDPDNAGTAYVRNVISQTAGTMEFRIKGSDVGLNKRITIAISDGSVAHGVYISIAGDTADKLQYYDGAFINLADVVDDTWYHLKITFTTAVYEVWLNGVSVGADLAVRGAPTLYDQVNIFTDTTDTGFTYYIDAVGYSWDADYAIGDNNYVEEGEADNIIFEGKISAFSELQRQAIYLEGLARRDLDAKPAGEYAGRSDEIITSLVAESNYITIGTLSAGTAMGTIAFGGDMTLEYILDYLAYFENWIWYLTPTGALYFNDGSVEMDVSLSETTQTYKVLPSKMHEAYNKVKVRGAYVDGTQVESDWYEDVPAQQLVGIQDIIIEIGFLNTAALCNIAAASLLIRLGTNPKRASFKNQAPGIGLMQPGEVMTFEFNSEGIIITSDKYHMNKINVNKQTIGIYQITDELP